MQHTYRVTRRHIPGKDETLVSSSEQARQILSDLAKKLKGRLPRHERATYLCARAVLYEALGDPAMLKAAKEAYDFAKTAQSAALVAVALHHFGRIRESLEWYERSWKYPHEPGWEVDIGYSNALLFQQTPETWEKAWAIVKQLKKRMVYAAYLPFWDGKPNQKVSVISEGGFGDVIQNCRWLPIMTNMGIEATAYFPPYFFEHGFIDLVKRQGWFPEVKLLTEVPMKVPAAGFFDLPAVFNVKPNEIPGYPGKWIADPERIKKFSYVRKTDKPNVGFCYAARAMETPLCPDGVYRSLTKEQANKILSESSVNWVSLQKEDCPHIQSWEDTAAIIENLDAVITVDTAVAHLAAVMEKPTWVMLSGAVDWKFGIEGDTCLWYPTMKLFRNDDFGFDKTVEKIIKAIREWQTVQLP